MDQNEPARSPAAEPVEERLADILKTREGPVASHLGNVLGQLSALDRAIYTAIAATPSQSRELSASRDSRLRGPSRSGVGVAAIAV